MSEPAPPDPGAPDTLAAEYALGVLDAAEHDRARRRVEADPTFAREVQDWEERLAGLAEQVAPVTPPADLWARTDRALDGGEMPGAAEVVVLRLRRSVARWRAATALAAGIAAGLVLALFWPRPGPAVAPMLAARLSAPGQAPPVFVALYDPARKAIVLTPASVSASAGRSPELWLIPSGGKPIALGVADFKGSVQLVPAAGVSGLGVGVLAVSVEPKGGSPTGQPTGPVIATGRLQKL